MLHKEIPFLRLGLPLCLGIISGLRFHPGNNLIIILLTSAIFLYALSNLFNKRLTNPTYGIFLSFTMILAGNLLYNSEKTGLSVLEKEESVLLCSITDYPEEKENTYSITVKLLEKYSANGIIPLKGYMLLYHDKKDSSSQFIPGDILILKCTPIEVTNRGNPEEFDYRFYLENRGIKYYSFTDSTNILKKDVPIKRSLRNHAFIMRNKIIEMFEESGIKGERLALVAAITLGQKSLLDPETKLNFSKAGAMHIMAVSGLNAGILSMFIFNILFFLKGKLAPVKSVITILIIWLFAFITGLSPSVERATLMFSFIQTGKLINRAPNAINSVIASAFVMLIIHPSVLFDTGFQLSYVAVLFIIGFYEELESKIKFNKRFPELIWQAIVVTLLAQAGTLALTIMSFNRFPVYFLLTNLIVVPVSSLMIILAFLVIVTFPVHFLSYIVAAVLNLTTSFTEESTKIISSFNYSSIDNIGMSSFQCILLTLFIALFLYWLLRKETFGIWVPLLFLTIFLIEGSTDSIKNNRSNELVVYNTTGSATIGIRTGDLMNIYRKDLYIPAEVIRHCAVKGLKIKVCTLPVNLQLLTINDSRIVIDNNLTGNETLLFNTDFLILTGKKPQCDFMNEGKILPQNIIITSEAVQNFSLPCNSSNYNYSIYYVRDSGAFSVSL